LSDQDVTGHRPLSIRSVLRAGTTRGWAVNLRDKQFNLAEWNTIIEESLADPDSEPLFNLDGDDTVDGAVYDALFIGGGAGGRFGAAYMKAMGGRPWIIDAWPFLAGQFLDSSGWRKTQGPPDFLPKLSEYQDCLHAVV